MADKGLEVNLKLKSYFFLFKQMFFLFVLSCYMVGHSDKSDKFISHENLLSTHHIMGVYYVTQKYIHR